MTNRNLVLRFVCTISLYWFNVRGLVQRGGPVRQHMIGNDRCWRQPQPQPRSNSGTALHCSLRNRRKQKRDELVDQERQCLESNAGSAALHALSHPANEDAPAFPVPPSHRDPHSPPITHHITFYSFEELFPGSNLAEVFDTNGSFRRALRVAARADLAGPGDCRCDNLESAVMGSWRAPALALALVPPLFATLAPALARAQATSTAQQSNIAVESTDVDSMGIDSSQEIEPAPTPPTPHCTHLTAVFFHHRITLHDGWLDGPTFLSTLTALCGPSPHVFGSWMDIPGVKGRPVHHSWHQDSGLDQRTVMVGFPPTDRYSGVGVYSHAVKLSHRLPTPGDTNEPRLWTQVFQTDSNLPTGDNNSNSNPGMDANRRLRP
jgi:hypothetical protein